MLIKKIARQFSAVSLTLPTQMIKKKMNPTFVHLYWYRNGKIPQDLF